MKDMNNATIMLGIKIKCYCLEAQENYGIDIKPLSITIDVFGDDVVMTIKWFEEGTTYEMPIHYADTFNAEQLFNIWMETDWTIYAIDTMLA